MKYSKWTYMKSIGMQNGESLNRREKIWSIRWEIGKMKVIHLLIRNDYGKTNSGRTVNKWNNDNLRRIANINALRTGYNAREMENGKKAIEISVDIVLDLFYLKMGRLVSPTKIQFVMCWRFATLNYLVFEES